jgi:sigma-B regulation protein RsbU (phosphoserine phosphatase)
MLLRSSQAKPPSALSRPPRSVIGDPTSRIDPLAPTLPPVASPRILVVDDEDINCRLLSKMLEWEGYQVRRAGDGASAIAEVLTWRPEVVVMDVNMPRMTGLEALREMQDQGLLGATSVMLLTAGTFDSEYKSEAIEAGACDFLEKPISRRELIARVGQRLKAAETLDRAQKSRAALEVSMSHAASVMVSLMPPAYIDARPGRIETLVVPSHAVGGDVVDFVRVNEHAWAAFLLDVAGHGLAAALTASASRAILLDQLASTSSLAGALRALNKRLIDDFDRTGHQAAVAAAFVNARAGTVEIVNAGCPPVAVWMKNGAPQLVRSSSPPAGLIDDATFAAVQFPLADVTRIVIVSDGVVEPFGPPTDTLGALAKVCGTSALADLRGLPSERIHTSLSRLGPDRDDASLVWIDLGPRSPDLREPERMKS